MKRTHCFGFGVLLNLATERRKFSLDTCSPQVSRCPRDGRRQRQTGWKKAHNTPKWIASSWPTSAPRRKVAMPNHRLFWVRYSHLAHVAWPRTKWRQPNGGARLQSKITPKLNLI